MLFNKKKRIQYLGFDDFWFGFFGVLILSFVANHLFSFSNEDASLVELTLNWSISLFFSFCNWMVLRWLVIQLRKRYPRFNDNIKRFALFFLILIGSIVTIDFVGNAILSYSFGENFHPAPLSKIMLPVLLISVMTMAIYEAMYYYIRLQHSIREEEQAKQVVVQAKLDALRNQAQPHFLFNSLNTLRDIIDQNSKEDAKQFVDKLAAVYRFILESGTHNLITLRDELKFAKAYIHIQSERFGDNLKLNWNIPDSAQEVMIVPMSLQLLLENAIKHNVISRAKPLLITVEVSADNLVVKNKIAQKSTQMPSTKVGLRNIEKRYSLISERAPVIINDGNIFQVSIPLLKSSDQKIEYANTDH